MRKSRCYTRQQFRQHNVWRLNNALQSIHGCGQGAREREGIPWDSSDPDGGFRALRRCLCCPCLYRLFDRRAVLRPEGLGLYYMFAPE